MKFEQFDELTAQLEHLMLNFNAIINENGTPFFLFSILSEQMSKTFIQNNLNFLFAINFVGVTPYANHLAIETAHFITDKDGIWRLTTEEEANPTAQAIISYLTKIKSKYLQGEALQLYHLPLIDEPGIYQHLFLWCHRINAQTIHCYVNNLKYKHPNLAKEKYLFYPISRKELLNEQLCIKKYSKYQINNAFKHYFNTSYTLYYQQLKLIKCYEYILLSPLPFKEIALYTGYNTYSGMHRAFLKHAIFLKDIPRLFSR